MFGNDLVGWEFSEQNLSGASFMAATLTNAAFGDAVIDGANFANATNFVKEQLYSSSSYKSGNLRGIGLAGINASGWDFRNQDLTEAAFVFRFRGTSGPAILAGALFDNATITHADFTRVTKEGFTKEQLYSTWNYQVRELSGIRFDDNDLQGWNFAEQSIDNASFSFSNLGREQLYATASYGSRRLQGVGLAALDLSDWNLANQNLTQATFSVPVFGGFAPALLDRANLSGSILHNSDLSGCSLIDANLSQADMRGSINFYPSELGIESAITANLIHPDGKIVGLVLSSGERLVIRDYDGDPTRESRGLLGDPGPISITVFASMSIDNPSGIQFVFESDTWDSRISFEPDILVQLGGTLELTFADDVDVASQLGRTLRIFDWTGVNPTGEFQVVSRYTWDLTNLYTTGEVTLTAVPEPTTLATLLCALVVLCKRCRQVQRTRTN